MVLCTLHKHRLQRLDEDQLRDESNIRQQFSPVDAVNKVTYSKELNRDDIHISTDANAVLV